MTADFWRLDATDLARLIRFGRASAREATESCLSRLRAINPAVNAVVRVLEEALRPLHGMPVTTNQR
jgi:Asp-tRNA(Asn)/Glu-tRNA(Gln) amidotransferase A subunit family amidase